MVFTSTEIFIMLIILIIPFLYESCKAFRYYLKFFSYYGIIMLTSIIVIPIMVWHPRDVRNLVLASMLCSHISRLLGLNWELKGKEHLEKDESCVIVANHQSSLDILGMFELWPVMQKCTVVAKKELFYTWPFGLAAWLCGLIFIDRLNSESAKTAINCSIERLKTDKVKLWIFPEGTRKNTGEIHSFKKGAFHTAINAELPILPIVFTEFYFLDKYQKRLDTGHVVITVLPPISTKGMSQRDVPALAESTRQLMVDAFNTSSQNLKEQLLLIN